MHTHVLRVLAFLATLTCAYPPTCSPMYGHPKPSDCYQILDGWRDQLGFRSSGSFFAVAGTLQLEGVTNLQFENKVDIPRFWPLPTRTLILFMRLFP